MQGQHYRYLFGGRRIQDTQQRERSTEHGLTGTGIHDDACVPTRRDLYIDGGPGRAYGRDGDLLAGTRPSLKLFTVILSSIQAYS